ncbi:patatin-like phospholipase domain-containing protein [Magnaporthiopsis poae ATCC 64411]|uniref:Patatin-like phospholipase domain-containing protein n=1 Tax=Magnaporthiopsis poae (strain ATCC 64411 / 73-15) TaxID=644358 RepID=A0A0C4E637_MAGP6|nr:patatin-like phospholipase domain-containing protein [Magnaporthiopsis poae ATCC 64411]
MATRAYISIYEQFIAWRGKRETLRRNMRATSKYADWVAAAKELDSFLGNGAWKEQNEFAYYDSKTVRRVWEQLRRCRIRAEQAEGSGVGDAKNGDRPGSASLAKSEAVEDLKVLLEACIKNNFVGVENPRLYSQTYYGTKNLVQNYVDEVEKSLNFLLKTQQMNLEEKRSIFKRTYADYGRTALCLSGGASFAYYHFGVVRALLDEDLLPDVITGTSGGALVAALVATRTDDELKKLLVPSLAVHITACREPITVWVRRWWKTGARFDSVDWVRQCAWWTRGSMTFREAYERTGRILNVSCVPADPHSPTILCNYLTSPDCVIWSAVLASAAVPGILNPVVLMMKKADGSLAPYSFGHKWKDGSLRTDIPIRALNLQFNVNFTIVSQVNPHINLFFFSSRGSVGQPVTHRRGRGWRGGFLGSATEQYIKLDLTKWLKVLRQLELLPRPLGQDWSQLWLQQFGGTVTIWPKSVISDFWHILSDPDPARLARMLHEGQQSAFPKIKFVSNRLRIERLLERGRRETRPHLRRGSVESIISEDDLKALLRLDTAGTSSVNVTDEETTNEEMELDGADEEAIITEDEADFVDEGASEKVPLTSSAVVDGTDEQTKTD